MSDEEGINSNSGQEAEIESEPKTLEKDVSKLIRVLTVVAYLLSVSMAAIMLSLYYIFLWNPALPNASAQVGDPPVVSVNKSTHTVDTIPGN